MSAVALAKAELPDTRSRSDGESFRQVDDRDVLVPRLSRRTRVYLRADDAASFDRWIGLDIIDSLDDIDRELDVAALRSRSVMRSILSV